MIRALFLTSALAVTFLATPAGADDLTAIIQTDLQTLGYEPGSTDGEMTVQTAVAVSKFQAENGLEVTGEVSPQLAGVIKAAISKQGKPAPVAQAAAPAAAANPTAAQQQAQMAAAMQAAQMQGGAAMDPAAMQAMMAAMQDGTPAMDPAMLQAMQAQAAQQQAAQAQSAQQACLQEKVAAAQKAQEAAQKKRGFGSLIRAAARIGGSDVQQAVAEAQGDLYNINATVSDLESAARDLGLTEDEVAACQSAQ